MLTSVDRFDLGQLSHTGKVKLLEETVRRRLDLVNASTNNANANSSKKQSTEKLEPPEP